MEFDIVQHLIFFFSNCSMMPQRLSEFILQRIGFEHTRHILRYGLTTIGRGLKADLVARTEYAGRNHCVIRVEDDRVWVKDNDVHIIYIVQYTQQLFFQIHIKRFIIRICILNLIHPFV